MKTNFLQKSKRPRESYGSYAAIAAAIAVFIFGFIFSGATEQALHFVLSPVLQSGMFVEDRVSDFFSVFYYKQRVLEDNGRLRADIARLEGSHADYQATKAENAALSAELGRKPKETAVAAAVLLRAPELPYDTFLLDVGSEDGIQAGDKVLGPDESYLGFIAEAYGKSSKALLASTPGMETKALLGGFPVTFIGKGGGVYEAHVPQAAALVEGTAVSLDPGYFTLGTVAKIETDANNAYRKVIVRSEANFSEIRYVFVIKSAPLKK